MNKDKIIFIVGTIIAYLGLFFAPSLKILLIPFAIFFINAFIYFRDVKKSLFTLAVFALPYSWGKALGSNYERSYFIISAFSGSVILLSFLSLKEKIRSGPILPYKFILLFLFWAFLSSIFNIAYPEVIDGLYRLSIAILFYFLSLIYIRDKKVRDTVIVIILSTIFFESFITIMQFFVKHPLGIQLEESIRLYPFGRVASEDMSIFRPSGTFVEPTYLSRFMTMLLPFVFLRLKKTLSVSGIIFGTGLFLSLTTIFISQTRTSWLVTIILFTLILFMKKPKISFQMLTKKSFLLISLCVFGFWIFFYPYFQQRIETSPLSFGEGGSFDTRIKLIHEAVNLIQQYPLFGVGLNRFMPLVQANNITGFFQNYITPVHNVFLLIISEVGIPAPLFFLGFIFFSYKYYFKNKPSIENPDLKSFKNLAALGGLAYLLEAQMGTIFLTPHLSLFLLYIAIILA